MFTASFFYIVYYLGIASCGMQGANKTNNQSFRKFYFRILISFLNSFGGGLLRDTVVLLVPPAVFSAGSKQDVAIALYSGLLYYYSSIKYETPFQSHILILITDAIGLGSFISIGVDNSIGIHCNPFFIILSGIVTALGGGIVACLFCGQPIESVLSSGVPYRIVTVGNTILYAIMRIDGVPSSYAQLPLFILTSISALMCDDLIRTSVITRVIYACQNEFRLHGLYCRQMSAFGEIDRRILSIYVIKMKYSRVLRVRHLHLLFHHIQQ